MGGRLERLRGRNVMKPELETLSTKHVAVQRVLGRHWINPKP